MPRRIPLSRPVRVPLKRQTTLPFLGRPLDLPQFLIDATELVGLRPDYVARAAQRLAPADGYGYKPSAYFSTIKTVRQRTSLGLAEAKQFVDACVWAYPRLS